MMHGSFVIEGGREDQERIKAALTGLWLAAATMADPVVEALAVLRRYDHYPPAKTAHSVYETLEAEDALPADAEKRVGLIYAVFSTIARDIDFGRH
ncbi:hypothetical protein HOU02_gp060 [Caulobacter phage CcrBL9]|uniref:Uncharacterized protein n=1 Tax=Caulobacter phage CcrBL9 TaxID=2283270 RepID=A0A385EB34_9CAUD|nr:hypothetical protein HOU02_gp060 [Caulobacter phage CcrBL9]AXQ69084.1 hypothetical protein CcrBL9_gp060c [Caulobacter phage CcrBL9]